MAKILFVNPTVREEDVPRHVPYGIALLAAISEAKGHQVQVYDHNAWRQDLEVVAQVYEADDWDVIAMGGITTAYGSLKQLIPLAAKKCPKSVIVLGGGILTSLPREMMNWLTDVDVGVVGEAFETFPEILEMVDAGESEWAKIDGTICRGDTGRIVMARPRALIENLDDLPYPAWDMFPLEEIYFKNSATLYSEEGMLATRRLDINMSYGCSLICRFCYHLGTAGDMRYVKDENGDDNVAFDEPGIYNRSIRYHSPEYVVRMVKHMYEKYRVNFVAFLDENLMTMDASSGRTWMKEICRLWKVHGLQPSYLRDGTERGETWEGVHWSGTSHATLCTQEILKEMHSAGCSHLVYGYESFASHVLKKLGKGSSPKSNRRSFFWTLEAGIRPIPNQIIGFPNDDFESLRMSMKAWEDLGIQVMPFFATAYPGSEWFAVYRKSIERQYDGELESFILDLGDATKITATISHNFSPVELLGLREIMVNGDYRHLDQYEAIWRRNHGIPDGEPSTIYRDSPATPSVAKIAAS